MNIIKNVNLWISNHEPNIFVHVQVELIKSIIFSKGNSDKNFPNLYFTLLTK